MSLEVKKRKYRLQTFLVILIYFSVSSPGQTATLLQVVLRDSRQVLWERPIASGDHFFLVHRNSIYDSLVWEGFLVDTKGRIWLNRIKTDSPAVLEYYGFEDSSSDWIRLSRKIGRIPMLITQLGEVRLELGNEQVCLSVLIPEGTLIEIQTEKLPQQEYKQKESRWTLK